ncbi:MAG TPA: xanthine dehydrogenase family protein subunit M [Candidatus Dormibacteraeota bacterium]|jgi:carbon-monoxide dehydrogenase medium subunit
MFPPAFEYAVPQTLNEALAVVAQRGDEARPLAGGQSLIPLLKLRLASPALLVDLGNLSELTYVEENAMWLAVGALVRHSVLGAAQVIRARYPTMAAAAPQIADPLIRNMGTLGGSLAHADPAGDWGSVMLALDAGVVALSRGGERVIPIADFFQGPFTTALDATEVLTQVRVPRPRGRVGGTYLKLERKVGDFATVGVAVQVEMSNGTIGSAGIGLTAVGPQNIKATAAEAVLQGARPTEDVIAEAARLAAAASEPRTDVRGSAEYKRDVVRVFVQRGLRAAIRQAQEVGA